MAGLSVLMINRFFYPFLGGVEFHIQNLGLELTNLGCRVTVACLRSTNLSRREAFRGLEVRRIAGLHELHTLTSEGFDVVHVHMPRRLLTLAALVFARQRGLPTVLTPHCFYPSRTWFGKTLKWAYDSVITPQVLRLADRVINLTENDQADSVARGLAPEKSRIIPNSVRVAALAGVRAVDFRAKYNVTSDFVLHVGRFDQVKNVEFLVRALAKLDGIGLVLIGQDGGRLKHVSRVVRDLRLEDRVRILTKASFEDLCGAYRQARVLALASSYEGLPTVLLEALYFGCPVVAARVGGIPYLLKDESAGYCYKFNDQAEYLRRIRRVLTLGREAASRGKSLVQDEYSWEVNAGRVLEVYEEARAERSLNSTAA